MRVAVMGTGGTGGFFGGLLARAGEDVTFIARGAHLEALRARGLTVKSRLAGDFTIPVQATDAPSTIGPVDLVLFCVKTYQTGAAADQIRPLVGPDTAVLSVQNGVDNHEQIGQIVAPPAVIGGVALVISAIEAPGAITQTAGAGKIILGELVGEPTPRIERFRAAFQRAGIAVEARAEMRVAIWQKWLFICGFGGLTALTRLSIGQILTCPETSTLFRSTVAEAEAVARGRRIPLAQDAVDQALALAASVELWGHGSLYHDLVHGRRLELEALNGALVRLGNELGVSTPSNFAIYAALKPYANGAPARVNAAPTPAGA